jgi:hypothetical protein
VSTTDIVEFSEPSFRSVARAPHDSKPVIAVTWGGGQRFGFIVEFAAGSESAERPVMTFDNAGTRQSTVLIRRGELLWTRVQVPVGHEVLINVTWQKVAP